MQSQLNAFVDALTNALTFAKKLVARSDRLSAKFMDAVFCREYEKRIFELNMELERCMAGLEFALVVDNESRRREDFEALMKARKADFNAVMSTIGKTAESCIQAATLKEEIQRCVLQR